jgi:hypothetical protein
VSTVDEIKAKIDRAKVRLATHLSERARMRAKLASLEADGASAPAIGAARYRLDMFEAKVNAAKRVVRELQAQRAERQEIEEMRRHDDEPVTAPSGTAAFPWRVLKTFGTYRRGQTLTDAEVAEFANFDVLERGGYIGRRPEPRAKVFRPLPPTVQAAPIAPSNTPSGPVEEARAAIRAAAIAHNVPRRAAIDLISANVLQRAIGEIAATPRMARESGGLVRSGVGTVSVRRITTDAIDILIGDGPWTDSPVAPAARQKTPDPQRGGEKIFQRDAAGESQAGGPSI